MLLVERFGTLPLWRSWVWPTRAAGVLTTVCVVVYAVWSVQASGLAGTFERLVVVIPGIWGYAVIARLGRGVPFVVQASSVAPTPAAQRRLVQTDGLR